MSKMTHEEMCEAWKLARPKALDKVDGYLYRKMSSFNMSLFALTYCGESYQIATTHYDTLIEGIELYIEEMDELYGDRE